MAHTDGEMGTLIRCGLVHIPPAASLVSDADEEVFLLYTALAGRSKPEADSVVFRGLGHVDSHQDALTVEFAINRRPLEDIVDSMAAAHSRRPGSSGQKSRPQPQDTVIAIELLQDPTALRSRKGDTGSVLWRASLDFAQHVLQDYYSLADDALLDPDMLARAHVLELGAGTGLLGIALSPIVARYTLTDVDALVPLIHKNVAHNRNLPKISRSIAPRRHIAHGAASLASRNEDSKVVVEALDWEVLLNAPPALRRTSFQYPPIDLLLVVDCIYHPSLIPALLATIDHLATPDVTDVLIVVELRAEDVIREFLAAWLSLSNGVWEIWSVPDVLAGPYAMWVGWKSTKKDPTR